MAGFSVIIHKPEAFAIFGTVDLDGTAAIGTVNVIAWFLVPIQVKIRITYRALIFFHKDAPLGRTTMRERYINIAFMAIKRQDEPMIAGIRVLAGNN